MREQKSVTTGQHRIIKLVLALILALSPLIMLPSAPSAHAQPLAVYRLNMGGPAITVGATTWAQCSATGTCSGYLAGGSSNTNTRTIGGIPAGMNNAIFQSQRFAASGNITLTFPVNVGSTYRVRVYIAENTLSYSPNRVFPLQYNLGGLPFNPQTLCTINPGSLILDQVYTCDVTIPNLAVGTTSLQIIATYNGAGTEPIMNAVEVVEQVNATPTNTPLPTSTPTNTPLPTSTPTNTPLPTSTPTNTPTDAPLPTSTPMSTPTSMAIGGSITAIRLNLGGPSINVNGTQWLGCVAACAASDYEVSGQGVTSASTLNMIANVQPPASEPIYQDYTYGSAWYVQFRNLDPALTYRLNVHLSMPPSLDYWPYYSYYLGSTEYGGRSITLSDAGAYDRVFVGTAPLFTGQNSVVLYIRGSAGEPVLLSAVELLATNELIPTATPFVMYTLTPLPPTATPDLFMSPAIQETRDLTYIGLIWSIFAGVLVLGLLGLLYLRR